MSQKSEELERLIREQESDQKYGNRVRGLISLDTRIGTDASAGLPISDFLDDRGTIHLKPMAPRFSCPYHPASALATLPSGRVHCRTCNKERCEQRRRLLGVRQREKGPQCGHAPDLFKVVSGRVRCSECLRAADRRSYWRRKGGRLHSDSG